MAPEPALTGERMTAESVLAGLRREYERLMAAIDALGDRADTVAVTEPGGWTAHDVLAHLIHYGGQVAFGLGAPGDGPPAYVVDVTERLSGQEWNQRAVAYWRDFDLNAVRAEFSNIAVRIIDCVSALTDEQVNAIGTISWYPPDRPLWQFIGGDTFLHEWPAHAAQIEAARDS